MIETLLSLLGNHTGILGGIGAAIAAVVALVFGARRSGKESERLRNMERERKEEDEAEERVGRALGENRDADESRDWLRGRRRF